MEDLRKGKADVLESGHSLILGWSDKILPIVDQLCNANASEGGRPIVIMSEMEKQVMEGSLAKHAPNLRGSSIICRCAALQKPCSLECGCQNICRGCGTLSAGCL